MSLSPVTIGILIGVACAIGALCAYLGWTARGKRAVEDRDAIVDEWQSRLSKETREKLVFGKNNETLKAALDTGRNQLEKLKAGVIASTAENRTLQEDLHTSDGQIATLKRERDNLAERIASFQSAVEAARQRSREIESEFVKSREFYKNQLLTAAEQRQSKDNTLNAVLLEKQETMGQVDALRAETIALQSQLATTQIRLDSQDALEQKIIALEADNAELKHDLMAATQALNDARDSAGQLTEIRAENQALAKQIKALLIEQETEKPEAQPNPNDVSETLRVKLNDFQTRLAEMQQDTADAVNKGDAPRAAEDGLPPFGIEKPAGSTDDLTKIVGVGKVFEGMLQRLGVYYYQQIATFGPAELKRINSELNEFKGRIEQDNWVGQAKRLHAEKYGSKSAQSNAW